MGIIWKLKYYIYYYILYNMQINVIVLIHYIEKFGTSFFLLRPNI